MSEHKIPIPSMLYNAVVGGHVTSSQQIIDENLNREQNDINQETVGAVPYNSTTPNGMGRIVLKKNDNFKTVVEAQTNGNTIFVIKYDFTLTDNVAIPANCVLEFNGGSLSGAYTIIGNNTIINAQPRVHIFSSIDIQGTWNVPVIYTEWMEMSYSEDSRIPMASILRLQNDDVYNNIYLPNNSLYFLPVESEDEYDKIYILLTSHTHLHIPNTINVISNSLPDYKVVFSSAKNDITIDGGGTLIGDCETHTYTEGSTHEQGHGIMLYNVSNSTIKDITIIKFTGDGFYLGGNNSATITIKNINLYNLTADSNRRQGLSVTASTDNLLIRNCKFVNTGTINGTTPMSGINLEPNTELAIMKNIFIEDCLFENNQGKELKTQCPYIENLVVSNCTFKNYTESNGEILYGGYALGFNGYHKNTVINNCNILARIEGHSGSENNKSNVTFNNCNIKAIYSYNTTSSNVNAEYVFNSCNITLKDEYNKHVDAKQTFIYCRNNRTDFVFNNCYYYSNGCGIVSYQDAFDNKVAAYNCMFESTVDLPNFNILSGCKIKGKTSYVNLVADKGLQWEDNIFNITVGGNSFIIGLSPKSNTITGTATIKRCKFMYDEDKKSFNLYNAGYFSSVDFVLQEIEATNILKFCNTANAIGSFASNTVDQPNIKQVSGTTAERTGVGSWFEKVGNIWFDTSLSPIKPLWWNGTAWVDATGTPV